MKRKVRNQVIALVTGFIAIGIAQCLPKFFAGLVLILAGVIVAGIFAQGE